MTFIRCRLGLTELPQNLCPLRWLYLAGFASCHRSPDCVQSQRFHLRQPLWGALTVHYLQCSPSPPKFRSPFLHCAIRKRLLLKGFHEVFMNFLGRHSLLTRVLYHCSNSNFLHFVTLTHLFPLYSDFLL